MGKKVFVSYSHHQGEWVRDRLCACLKGGGAEVLIDVERFEAGRAVYRQMDAYQDEAYVQVLVLSPEYLSSVACSHEMERAIAVDPAFGSGRVIPVVRVECALPDVIKTANPLWVNLREDAKADQWELLLDACGVDLGVDAPAWLAALGKIRSAIEQRQSVNLRVTGRVEWQGMLDLLGLKQVDLNSGAAAARRGLVAEILEACGHHNEVKPEPEDLADLQTRLENSGGAVVALLHFDRAKGRPYGEDLYWALSHLVDVRKLTLVVQSRELLSSLAPPALLQSGFVAKTRVVELRGR